MASQKEVELVSVAFCVLCCVYRKENGVVKDGVQKDIKICIYNVSLCRCVTRVQNIIDVVNRKHPTGVAD